MGLVDKLKQEFDLKVEWLGFEIHADTPPGGTPLLKMFPRADVGDMTRRLNSMGAPFGLTFQKIVTISNSRLSLEAGEFAKEQGRFEQFHHAVFQAYFTQGKDIGRIEVLKQLGKEAGLDADALEKALETGKYRRILEEAKGEAARLGITAAPTFIFNDKDRIVGAQSLDVFRERLKALNG
jgi:predicted DsbA family dithiol-disulfide isomerase